MHRFAAGRPLVLGGVEIEHASGLAGHSDADVLCHAVADALLGAVSDGDIGRHFPDTDPQWEGVSSLRILETVARRLAQRRAAIVNVDATVIAQRPKLAPHIAKMRANLAAALGIDADQVSVKATTTERLGFSGREEGIAAQATAAICPHAAWCGRSGQ